MGSKYSREVLERVDTTQQGHASMRMEGMLACVAWRDGTSPHLCSLEFHRLRLHVPAQVCASHGQVVRMPYKGIREKKKGHFPKAITLAIHLN